MAKKKELRFFALLVIVVAIFLFGFLIYNATETQKE